ncbi:MGDG synthase family glycosyltransferase [Rubritalea marina]|uniref:MGDG synthase family glycosyltransferase n=1 Tax=Rubritalea marina TaxID=361055 RepID=UPI00036C7982|nr:hypothetical protein [Rubritalea marina]
MSEPATITKLPRIIITTAGFGEGHNSAANHIAAALDGRAEVEIIDPCELGAPWVNQKLRDLYRFITTHAPKTWSKIYKTTDHRDFSKERLPLMRHPELALHESLLSFEPEMILSTYPLYPYFIHRSFHRGARRVPVITVITDSIEINSSWTKAPTDFWFVTDTLTRQKLIKHGIAAEKLVVTGFPVHPRFETLSPVPSTDPCEPFRVLYFPTSKKPIVRRIMRAILKNPHCQTKVTVVLGRNVRKLYEKAREIQLEFPDRVEIKGWTRSVPELLTNHHLVIGKAGGATVHEAIAAQTPMLIHHLVPGQEEGNLTLLKEIGAGQLTESSKQVKRAIAKITENDASLWREMKENLAKSSLACGARTAADFALEQLKQQP